MAGAAPSAKPAPFLKPLDTLDRGVLLAESALSTVIVLVMVLVAVADSGSRLLRITHPALRAASDILMNGTLWAAFLGASFATRGRKHLAIDAVSRLLPERGRHVVAGMATTLGSVVAFALAKGVGEALLHQAHTAAEQLEQLRSSGATDASVDRSFEFHFVIPAGFLLISLRLLLHGFHEFVAAIRGDKAPVSPSTTEVKPEDAPEGHYRESPESDEAHKHDAERPAPPILSATLTEAIIAFGFLLLMLIPARGTTVFAQLLGLVLVTMLTLAVPLALRKQKTGGWEPTAAREKDPDVTFAPAHLALALVATGAVLGGAKVFAGSITSMSIGTGVACFVGLAILGAPLFTFLGGMALFLWLHGLQSADGMWVVAPQQLANAVEDALGPHFARMSVLPTIPVFTLAGYLMSESKTPQRLVRVARAFLGWAPGGLAIVCLFASAFFTIFSGASGITIVAIGGLLYPALVKDKYPENFSLGLVTTGGALGITFPPCLPLIVYGIVAGLQEAPPGQERLELQKFLLAGLIPGLLTIVLLAIYAFFMGIWSKVPRSSFDGREAGAALWEAKWELLLPVFLLGGLATGVFNPSQAAAFTAFYVLIIEVFIYKDLSFTRDLPRIIPESMVLVGAIFVKLCAATVLTAYFIDAQTADRLFETLTCGPPAQAYLRAHPTMGSCREAVDALAAAGQSAGGMIDSKLSFLMALNVFLLVVGMLMDIFSAIVVVVPLISGIASHFEINPYHLGIVFLINLEIGYLMPPMGLNLFIAGFRFNRPVPDLYRMVGPFIALFAAALLLTTYVPSLTLVMVPGQMNRPHVTRHHPTTEPTTPTAGDAGAATTAPTTPAGNDCDVPREGESFDDFNRRCSGGGGGGAAPPAPEPAQDCDVPRVGESFDDFNRRCNAGAGTTGSDDAATPTPAATDAGAAPTNAAASSDASSGAPG